MQTELEEKKSTYLNIMSDGKFHQKVDEGTPGAVLREGDTKDGTHYSKWELISNSIVGKITKVGIYDGEYGKNLIISLDVDGESAAISMSTAQSFGEDMMHKILNINMCLPVSFTPYSVEKDGKTRKGIKVFQNNQEIWSYFQKWNKDLNKFLPINGMPEAPVAKAGKKLSSDEWKMYFMQVRIFMISVIEARFTKPEDNAVEPTPTSSGINMSEFEIDPEDVPF